MSTLPKIAICYDFDKTLSPDDMQTFTLIPSFGMKSEDFWKESDQLAKDHLMEKNLACISSSSTQKPKAVLLIKTISITSVLRWSFTTVWIHGLTE